MAEEEDREDESQGKVRVIPNMTGLDPHSWFKVERNYQQGKTSTEGATWLRG